MVFTLGVANYQKLFNRNPLLYRYPDNFVPIKDHNEIYLKQCTVSPGIISATSGGQLKSGF